MIKNLFRNFLARIYERNHKLRNLTLRLKLSSSLRKIREHAKSSRIVEYPWVYMNIDEVNVCKRLLDVGSVGSDLPIKIASQGCEVWCIDVRQYEGNGLVQNLRCLVGDVRKTSFKNDFFDCVIAVSTLEHIGLGRYGEWLEPDGDITAISEISRILSMNGTFLITLPFGKGEVFPSHRVYDKNRLQKILNGFKIEREDYFVRNKKGFWSPCEKECLAETRSPKVEMGLVCIKARKI